MPPETELLTSGVIFAAYTTVMYFVGRWLFNKINYLDDFIHQNLLEIIKNNTASNEQVIKSIDSWTRRADDCHKCLESVVQSLRETKESVNIEKIAEAVKKVLERNNHG